MIRSEGLILTTTVVSVSRSMKSVSTGQTVVALTKTEDPENIKLKSNLFTTSQT